MGVSGGKQGVSGSKQEGRKTKPHQSKHQHRYCEYLLLTNRRG